MLFRQDEMVSLDTGGLVLGAVHTPPVDFQVGEARLEVGDTLVCFTDGIIECANAEGQEYGTQRLEQLVHGCKDRSSRDIFDAILKDVDTFSQGADQTDDRTVIVIRRK